MMKWSRKAVWQKLVCYSCFLCCRFSSTKKRSKTSQLQQAMKQHLSLCFRRYSCKKKQYWMKIVCIHMFDQHLLSCAQCKRIFLSVISNSYFYFFMFCLVCYSQRLSSEIYCKPTYTSFMLLIMHEHMSFIAVAFVDHRPVADN